MSGYKNILVVCIAMSHGFLTCIAFGQDQKSIDTTTFYKRLYDLPDKFFNSIDRKTQNIEEKLIRQSDKYLDQLEKEELRLQRKLARKDSLVAIRTFGDVKKRYSELREKLNSKRKLIDKLSSPYCGHLDSMKSVLGFMQESKVLGQSTEFLQKIDGSLGNYESLQGKFAQVQEIKKYLKERQQQLQSQLQKLGMAKELQKFKKQVYYYRAQMDEYKRMFEDPSKLEAKALQLAQKIPAFKEFFSKYSDLAGLFRVPDDFGTLASLQGLQTRASVQQLIQQQIGSGGPNAQQQIQQNIQQAQAELSSLKDKVNQLGKGSSEIDMPDFKPNSQKTKFFLQRLELGTNLQTVKSNGFYPATTDLGLSVGYKFNDKSVFGIGASYKFGLGTINHIVFTHEGVGLRSFLDFNLKGSIWISGGGEFNYHSQYEDFTIFRNYSAWQRSALLGLSKKYSVGKKWKGNVQVLYDFLHAHQVPKTQPILFRFGYNLK